MAVKILVLLFLPLLEMQVITSFQFLLFWRESHDGLACLFCSTRWDSIPAQLTGKLKTAFTFLVCGILFGTVPVEKVAIPVIYEPIQWLIDWVMAWPVILFLVYAVVALTIWSFIDYFDHFLWGLYLKRWNNDEDSARQALRSLIPNFVSITNVVFGVLVFTLHLLCNFALLHCF